VDISDVLKSHPAWKHLEAAIDERRRKVLSEIRYSNSPDERERGIGELFGYEYILGRIPEQAATRIEEEQEKAA
jgi:hypothetical protein